MSIKTLYKKPTKYYIKKCKTTTKTNKKQTKKQNNLPTPQKNPKQKNPQNKEQINK